MELLCALWFAESIKCDAIFRAVFQPILKREAIALGLRNLLAFFVEEHFVNQAFGWTPAKDTCNLSGLHATVGQIFPVHFVIDANCDPTHGPIDLPLKLRFAAKDRLRDKVAAIVKPYKASFGINDLHRHLKDNAGLLANRQNRRISRGAFFAQGRQHDVHDALIIAQHVFQCSVKRPALILRR